MTTWIIIGIAAAGLIASLLYSINQQMDTAAELSTVTARLAEQTDKAKAAVTVLAGEREAMSEMARRLKDLERKRDRLTDTLQTERARRQALEERNDEYKTWAGSRLPDAAIRLLNESPFNPDNHAGSLQQRQSTDDTSVAPDPGRDNPQPQPDEPDRPVRRSPDNSERPDGSD